MAAVGEYWVVSAPGNATKEQTWRTLSSATESRGISTNHKFDIPNLKVGTLDALVALSDDLGKLDTFVESVALKLSGYIGELLTTQGGQGDVEQHLRVDGVTPEKYATKFAWKAEQYSVLSSVKDTAGTISEKVTQIDNEMKTKVSAYNKVKGNIQAIERKSHGSLLMRNLNSVVTERNFVLDSEHLVTLLVVVPKNLSNDWHQCYENLSNFVVPRSSEQVPTDDGEYDLFTVTLFRKIIDDFKKQARDRKFIVRDFEFNPTETEAGAEEVGRLEADMKRKGAQMLNWSKVSFSEAFSAWIHVKALRVFVESVLRYGLPHNFQAAVVVPHGGQKNHKSVRDALHRIWSHLDATAGIKDTMDIPGMMNTGEYFPYVTFTINIGQFYGSTSR